MTTTQLATRTPEVIKTAEEYRQSLTTWQKQSFNMLTPFTDISGLAEQHGIIHSLVQLNLERGQDGKFLSGDVYDGLPFLKKGEVAPAKNGLRKIAEGLGISTKLEYISVGFTRYYWHVKAIASYRGIDGATVVREASMEWDLRDGSDRLKGWTGPQIGEARKHGLRACETRAINAVIRECGCGIKQAYRIDELQKPFVAVRVIFQPDMSDPEVKKMVTQHSLSGTNTLYPNAGALPAGHTVDPFADSPNEPRAVGSSSTAKSDVKPEDRPPTELAVRVVDVTFKDGKTGDRTWRKYTITDSHGVVHSTFDRKKADLAEKFKADKTWCEITDEPSEDGKYSNIEEIGIAQPSLLDDDLKT